MVRTLDGATFAQVIHAGTVAVVRERDTLDRINVFPVPDADTGANLAATLRAAAARLGAEAPSHVGAAARMAADAALDGARGNSGAIFAQFLHGMAESLGERLHVGTRDFATAAGCGSDAAYSALQEPREGTILSVLRVWAHELATRAADTEDFAEAFGHALETARTALAETPRQLAILARSHVVDAGGQGFVFFLEGISEYFRTGRSEAWPLHELPADAPPPFAAAHADVDETFRFCAEALIAGDGLDRGAVMSAVGKLGGSLVVAGGAERLRIHLHTDEPQRFVALASTFGTLERTKVDDMILQQASSRDARIALVTDSTCDMPDGMAYQLGVVRVPLVVTIDGHTYRDGVDMTTVEFWHRIREARDLPKSSQPAVADFCSVYERLLEKHEGIVSVHIAGALSGTVQAAAQAAQIVGPERVRVVDSHKVSVGVSLLAGVAHEAIAAGASLDDVEAATRAARERVAVFGCVPDLEFAVRGGRVSRRLARTIGALHLVPVIAFNEVGRAVEAGIAFGFEGALDGLVKRATRFARGAEDVRAMVVHADNLVAAEGVAERLCRAFGTSDIAVTGGGPVITTHVGPGTVAVAVLKPA
jgi:uncharacterized protein